MMHQLLQWTDQYDSKLGPFAFEHAVYVWNNLPKDRQSMTLLELFSGMKQGSATRVLIRFVSFGDPL